MQMQGNLSAAIGEGGGGKRRRENKPDPTREDAVIYIGEGGKPWHAHAFFDGNTIVGLEEGAEQVSKDDALKWCSRLGLKVRGEKPELTWRLETFLQDRKMTLRDPLALHGVPELLFSPKLRCCCWECLCPDDFEQGTKVGPRDVAEHPKWMVYKKGSKGQAHTVKPAREGGEGGADGVV
jgi:hypothetical protein